MESVREAVGQGVAMGIIAAKKRQRGATTAEAARIHVADGDVTSTTANRPMLPSKKQRVFSAADTQNGAGDLAVASSTQPCTMMSAAAAPGIESLHDGEPAKIDMDKYSSSSELLADCGADTIKRNLAKMGLKCGGTPQARAERLWSTKGKALSELDPRMFAKKKSAY